MNKLLDDLIKKLFVLLCIVVLMVGCVCSGGSDSAPPVNGLPDEACVYTLNAGLSIDGYTGCWGDCPWYQEINCLVVGVYADEDCTEMIEAVWFPSPEVEPWEALLSVTREWPDEAWLLFYVTNCDSGSWQTPRYFNYYLCQGPHKIWFYKYDCGDTLAPHYSGIADVFDDSCVWGFRN